MAASPLPRSLPRHYVVAAEPAPSHTRLFYLSSVAPLDFHIEVILMPSRSYAFPLTLRRHNRLVPLPIIKSADQQSIFHQKLKLLRVCVNDAFVAQAAGPEDRARIVDAICADGGEIPMHRSGSAMTPFSATTMQITELSWTPPAPPIFAYIDKSLEGKRAALAYHEAGSLVMQHALEKPEENARTGPLTSCSHTAPRYLGRSRRASGAPTASSTSLNTGRRSTAKWHSSTNEQPAKGARRAIILIASVLLTARKDRCAALYECIRAHIVALCACKTGSKVIWLFVFFSSDRMRAYYG
ncbi:hypothetical protein DFH08DRAFT_1083471 [Mycena albidolilacea]|uniref:Uncharacterized protein n=1 Tax=Mycena albidolilacea TaxID=1033008 RepID=A0AAD6ZPR9_9AGAR|nr:hypothetical protein DFH08DRAFT_1083471 [Mycena albidolilacea]